MRYFREEHPRQEWCKPSCGNRPGWPATTGGS
ncbi:hypothetical protein [Streptomyces bullii]|uniref:Uncharacterized protein n=1 Tax=Streptomyces bullii TaxID=349910 RepID=A0ABW0UMG8_9ACTN